MCYVDMFYFVQTLTSHLNIYRYLFHVIVEIKEENFSQRIYNSHRGNI